MSVVPDYRPKLLKEKIAPKCSVLYFPVQMLQTGHKCLPQEKFEAEKQVSKHLFKESSDQSSEMGQSVPLLDACSNTSCEYSTERVSTVVSAAATIESGKTPAESMPTVAVPDMPTISSNTLCQVIVNSGLPAHTAKPLHILWPHRWYELTW